MIKELSINEFFDTQYKSYSLYDNERSIPNLIDGLKISQRKIIHTVIAKNITKEIKVAQLASLVAGYTAYHHGEAGLGGVICGLAQNYAGSNNHNFLEPEGQFGSRLSPIPAAHRYIYSYLSKNFRDFFKKEDDIILEYLYDDDQEIEPKYFIPIIPGILINGSEGIGTGFASKILPRDTNQVIQLIKDKLENKNSNLKLLPHFNKFKGEIEDLGENRYRISGCLTRINTTTIKITELPIGMYLEDIKKHLNKLIESGFIKDYDDNSSEASFDIDVYLQRTTLNSNTDENLLEKLKLTTTITENLTLWLDNGKIKKFNNVDEIIDYFILFRVEKYSNRINKLLELYKNNLKELSEKIRFINFYLMNVEKFRNASKLELHSLLDENLFKEEHLSIKIYNLTKDKIQELEDGLKKINKEINKLENTKPKELYLNELK